LSPFRAAPSFAGGGLSLLFASGSRTFFSSFVFFSTLSRRLVSFSFGPVAAFPLRWEDGFYTILRRRLGKKTGGGLFFSEACFCRGLRSFFFDFKAGDASG
jgi:hypothetical protein